MTAPAGRRDAAMAAPADALEPVRAELIRAARADADAALARARADADQMVRAARAQAESLLEQARRDGVRDGAAEAAWERVRARQDAWSRELAARAEVYAGLRGKVHAGIREAVTNDAALLTRLQERARALLGSDALITAADDGGVTARAAGRRVDLTADALTDRALARLGAEAETLWAP
ncbi:hypothetical protein [Streptomyces sp. MK5]|uniref:hypothetical protein n=1 Tax=Streptomyces sp. MK5 TaxID=3064253 RepID=UPI002741791C|nr:hypothetical protein [Streptomyces sp. MK5]